MKKFKNAPLRRIQAGRNAAPAPLISGEWRGFFYGITKNRAAMGFFKKGPLRGIHIFVIKSGPSMVY